MIVQHALESICKIVGETWPLRPRRHCGGRPRRPADPLEALWRTRQLGGESGREGGRGSGSSEALEDGGEEEEGQEEAQHRG